MENQFTQIEEEPKTFEPQEEKIVKRELNFRPIETESGSKNEDEPILNNLPSWSIEPPIQINRGEQ